MKITRALFLILFLAFTSFAQTTLTGKVSEVVDGQTVIMKTANFTSVKVKLQYIEVPGEAKNEFTAVVKNHLLQLLEGKTLRFQTRRMADFSILIGVLTADGVDVSQQMLRDGAAWYEIPEKENQEAAEREIYLKVEAEAKAEKRGVWGIKELRPTWENTVATDASHQIPAVEKQSSKTVSPASQASKGNSVSSPAN